MSETLLEIDNLRVQFDQLMAVDNVSFRLRGGDLLGMIGPNGAGKTTTLRAAAGLQSITTGKVRVLGHDVFENPTVVGHHLAFTPDTPQVYETVTVENFLRFIGRCYKLDARTIEERIDHWLEQLWLIEKKSARINSLSRGMRQRLAVARSLMPDPHVILMDEPAAGLDPAGRIQFRQLLASLRDQGKALIISSHILADLAEYCTHIGIMAHGRMLRFGTVSEVSDGDTDRSQARYRVRLAQRESDVAARLTRLVGPEGWTISPTDPRLIEVAGQAEPEAAAQLLGRLVRDGLPVAEFRRLDADLEQAYLRTGIGQVD